MRHKTAVLQAVRNNTSNTPASENRRHWPDLKLFLVKLNFPKCKAPQMPESLNLSIDLMITYQPYLEEEELTTQIQQKIHEVESKAESQ